MYNVLVKIVKVFLKTFFRVEITGEENIPKEGGCIICANHISNWDPVFLVVFLTRRVYFLAKEELFSVPFVGWLMKKLEMIPVKRNGNDISAVKSSLTVLKQEKALGIFPSGRRMKKGEKPTAKAGVALIAVKAAVPVVPIYIDATYRIFSKVKIHIGEKVEFASYNKAKLPTEVLTEISNDLFDKIYSLLGDKK